MDDDQAMQHALRLAREAAAHGEVPVGAVVLHDGEIIAADRNRREMDRDPLAHAEILVLRQAARQLGRWRLFDCTLVVTLEPCPMCAGAIVHSRIDRLVFATDDPRTGAAGSIYNIVQDPRLNHSPQVQRGVRREESAELLRTFFAERRAAQKKARTEVGGS